MDDDSSGAESTVRSQGGPPAVTTTERLTLRVPRVEDVPELLELYADPLVWRSDPVTRHTSSDQTERMVDRWREAWSRDGLGMWVARGAEPGTAGRMVGVGGCFVRHSAAWNLGFRLSPSFWAQGYAQELIRAALAAARDSRPDLPVTAYLLEGNDASRRATERTGLHLVWRGRDAGNPDPTAVRLLYADRGLPPALAAVLTAD